MNFIIEYYIKIIESSSSEENELNLSDKNTLSYAKHVYKIIFQKLVFDIKFQSQYF